MARKKCFTPGRDSLATTESMLHNEGGTPQNLDNGISAQPTVQVTREIVASNGCRVTLNFSSQSRPEIRIDIAHLLIQAFESTRRNSNEEASSLPVQSFNETAG